MRAKILGVVGSPEPRGGDPDPGEDVGPVRRRPREPGPADSPGVLAPVSGQTYDTEVSGPRDSIVEAHAERDTLPPRAAAADAADEEAAEAAPDHSSADSDDVQAAAAAADHEDADDAGADDAGAGDAGAVDEPSDSDAPGAEPDAPAPELSALPSGVESGVSFAPVLSTPGAVSAEDEALARRELFDTFIAEKARLGEPTDDLDFAGFQQLLDDVVDKLKDDDRVEQVRFDIRVHDGKVALQPRLVRTKP